MPHTLSILHRYPVVSARSIHQAREREALFNSADSYQALGDLERFHLTVNSVQLDGVRLSAVSTTGHRIRPRDSDNATLLVGVRGRLETDDGRNSLRVQGGSAVLPRPGARTTTIPQPYIGLVLQIPMPYLAAQAALNPEDVWRPDLDWPASASPRLIRTTGFVVRELDRADPLHPASRAARGMSRLLVDLFLEGFFASTEDRTRPAALPGLAQVRRAEGMLRARFDDAMSISALAGELGISTRALQAGFRRYRGTTPHEFLTTCRLEAARERLLNAKPGETVARIAIECGLPHLSRFAENYRDRYGEAPSTTLLCALRGK